MFATMKKNDRLAAAFKPCNNQAAVIGGTERLLYEQGRAAYAERKWDVAACYFQELAKEFPQSKEAPLELRRALARLTESRTGKYDFARMTADAKAGAHDIDVADYAGPVEVADVPGKGKGIVASEDVKMGTLLFVEKPFVSTVLARKSRLVKPLSHLTPSEVTERVLMHGHGLLLCGFGNHSCLPNSAISSIGDVKIVISVVDIKKGEEVTRPYVDPMLPFSERRLWFKCGCRLCELDRADPRREERENLLKAVMEDLPRIRSHAKFIAKAEDLLQKMRKTYGDRAELQMLLYWPLQALGAHYESAGNYRKAIQYYEEAIEALGPLLHQKGHCMMARIAFCYDALRDVGMARKYAQMAADLERLGQGHCSSQDVLSLL